MADREGSNQGAYPAKPDAADVPERQSRQRLNDEGIETSTPEASVQQTAHHVGDSMDIEPPSFSAQPGAQQANAFATDDSANGSSSARGEESIAAEYQGIAPPPPGVIPPLGAMAEEQELEADEFDSDSALGSDVESLTTSVAESMYAYRQEFGRTYHAYKDGKYIFPNDEREANRLDLQHHLFAKTFGNRLYFAPLHNPRNALDVGTGTGIWAIEFADEFPNCQVVGTDLSPGQPSLIPPNLKFVIDDAEDQWLYETGFDYIHLRLMAGCFSDWQNLFNQAFQNLEPNGWLELQDYGLPVKSADGTADGTDLLLWGELLCEAAKKLGRPMGSDASEMYEKWMRQAGFVDIQQRMFMWPTNGWPKNRYMKELGRWNQVNIMEGLEGFCLALLTRGLGWRKEEVDVFVAKVNRDLANKHIHGYFPMPVTYGRKPYPGEVISNS